MLYIRNVAPIVLLPAMLLVLTTLANSQEAENPTCDGEFKNVTLTQSQLSEVLKRHTIWLNNYDDPNGRKANLCGANLQDSFPLEGLEEGNLEQVDLSYANLQNAHLPKAILKNATLFRANLSKADLQYSILTDADLVEADLSEAKLQGADLSGALLNKTNFRKADLKDVNLTAAFLQEADLRNAEGLKKMQIQKSRSWILGFFSVQMLLRLSLPIDHNQRVAGRNLTSYDLRGVDLRDANLFDFFFEGSNLEDSNLKNANLQEAHMKNVKKLTVEQVQSARNWAIAYYDERLLKELRLPEDHNNRLKNQDLSGYNLSNMDFQGAQLHAFNLQGANFRESKLRRANLTGAQIQHAVLTRADLSGANLTKAKLHKVDLSGANLTGSDLTQANLQNAKLNETKLYGTLLKETNLQDTLGLTDQEVLTAWAWILALYSKEILLKLKKLPNNHNERISKKDLREYDLSGVDFRNSSLVDFKFDGANLSESNLCNANLQFASLRQVKGLTEDRIRCAQNWALAYYDRNFLQRLSLPNNHNKNLDQKDLSGYELNNTNLQMADLSNFKLRKIKLEMADLRKADLSEAKLQNAELVRVILQGATLDNADLSGAKVIEADLQDSRMNEVNFQNARLERANLRKATLLGANLSGAELQGAKLENANLNGADLTGSFLMRAELLGAQMNGAILNDASLQYANLQEASLGAAQFYGAGVQHANLEGAYLQSAELNQTRLGEANLSLALLVDSDLTGADLKETRLDRAIFELKYGSIPEVVSLKGNESLSRISFSKSPHSLIELRVEFKKMGLRDEERQITYAIEKRKQELMEKKGGIKLVEAKVLYLLFDFTCKYGMEPWRPIVILFSLVFVFSGIYIWGIKSDTSAKLYAIVVDMDKENRLPARQFLFSKRRLSSQVKWREKVYYGGTLMFIAIYFSLLMAFRIGWGNIDIGSWITRFQPKEYTLQATGWVRPVSAAQSIISVYLFVLWALTYFGRPFE